MKEIAEFRILEAYAKEFLPENCGVSLSDLVRKVRTPVTDELYGKIREFTHLIRKRDNEYFFLGWSIKREYSEEEIASSDLLALKINKTFEPAGEECGTEYNSQNLCEFCGSGFFQTSNLFLDLNSIPKNVDVAKTISDEIIINQKLRDLFVENNIKNLSLPTVQQNGMKVRKIEKWYQLITTSEVSIHPNTKTGEDPFNLDIDNNFRCPQKHVIGLNIISELSIYRKSWSSDDIMKTKELIGVNRGLLRASPIIIISQKVYNILKTNEIKGFTVEKINLID